MPTITALSAQKRNADRVNVYLDGEFAFGLALIAAHGLRVGQSLSDVEIASLKAQDEVERAKNKAIQLIANRPRSSAEIRRHLIKKGYDETVADEVVTRLTRVHLLDDAEFARYWVDQRETFKPRSQIALRQELMQKGVERSVIDAALEEVDEDAAARRLANKQAHRWEHLPEDEFRQKLMRYLQRRGFSYSIIKTTTEETWDAISAESDDNADW